MEDLSVKGVVEIALKGKGAVDAANAMRKIGDEAQQTSKALDKVTGSGERLGSTLARFFSVGALAAIAKSSVVEFAKLERSFNSVSLLMKNLGLDAERELPRVIDALTAMERAGDGLLSATIPAFTKFIGISKNVNEAIYLTHLAADVAESSQKDLAETTDVLANLMQGRAKMAAQQLGIGLFDLGGKEKTNVELVDEVIKRYEGARNALDDTQDSLDKMESGWAEASREVGKAFAPLSKFGAYLVGEFAAGVQLIGPLFRYAFAKASSYVVGFAAQFTSSLNFKRLAMEGSDSYLRGIEAAGTQATAVMVKEAEKAKEEMKKILGLAGLEAGKAEADGRARALAQARLAIKAEEERELAEKLKKAAELTRQAAEKRAAFELQTEQHLADAKLAVAGKNLEDQLQLRLSLMDKEQAAEVAKAKEVGADVARVNQAFELARQALIEETRRDQNAAAEDTLDLAERNAMAALELESEKRESAKETFVELNDAARERIMNEMDGEAALLEAQLEGDRQTLKSREELAIRLIVLDRERAKAAAKSETERIAIDKRANAEILKVERTTAAARQQIAFAVAEGALTLGDQIFENNKWLALANSLLNALEAASAAAAADAKGGAYAAIASYVATFAFVIQAYKTIKGVEKGGGSGIKDKKGFDNPRHDKMAEHAGAKWAEDWVKYTTAGWVGKLDELLGARAAAPASSQPAFAGAAGGGHQNNFYGPVLGGIAGERRLRRIVSKAERRDRSRRVK